MSCGCRFTLVPRVTSPSNPMGPWHEEKETFCLRAEVFFLAAKPRGGGGVLPIMAYTGRPRTKGVPFSGFRYFTS